MPVTRVRADQRGSVIVFVAVSMQVLLLLLAFALDIGNWYVHKRQLQNRVDDAAFAAALAYGYRFPDCTDGDPVNPDTEDEIVWTARQYAGDVTINTDAVVTAAYKPAVNTRVNDPAHRGRRERGRPARPVRPARGRRHPAGAERRHDQPRGRLLGGRHGPGDRRPEPLRRPRHPDAGRRREGAHQPVHDPEPGKTLQPFAVADPATPLRLGEVRATKRRRQDVPLTTPTRTTPGKRVGTVTMPDARDRQRRPRRPAVVLGTARDGLPTARYYPRRRVGGRPSRTADSAGRGHQLSRGGKGTCNGDYVYREGGCRAQSRRRRRSSMFRPDLSPESGQRRWAYTRTAFPGSHDEPRSTSGSNNWGGDVPPILARVTASCNVGISVQCGADPQRTQSEPTPIGTVSSSAIMAGNDSQEGPIQNFTLVTTSVNTTMAAPTPTFTRRSPSSSTRCSSDSRRAIFRCRSTGRPP